MMRRSMRQPRAEDKNKAAAHAGFYGVEGRSGSATIELRFGQEPKSGQYFLGWFVPSDPSTVERLFAKPAAR